MRESKKADGGTTSNCVLKALEEEAIGKSEEDPRVESQVQSP